MMWEVGTGKSSHPVSLPFFYQQSHGDFLPFLLIFITFLDAQRPRAAPWGAQLGVLSTELGSAPHSRDPPAAFQSPLGQECGAQKLKSFLPVGK